MQTSKLLSVIGGLMLCGISASQASPDYTFSGLSTAENTGLGNIPPFGNYWASGIINQSLSLSSTPVEIELDLTGNLTVANAGFLGGEVYGVQLDGISPSVPSGDIATVNIQLLENGAPEGGLLGFDLVNPVPFPITGIAGNGTSTFQSPSVTLPANLTFNGLDVFISTTEPSESISDFNVALGVTAAGVPDNSDTLPLLALSIAGVFIPVNALRRRQKITPHSAGG